MPGVSHTLPVHERELQSVGPLQARLEPHEKQPLAGLPPQSMSVSRPFLMPSKQLGG